VKQDESPAHMGYAAFPSQTAQAESGYGCRNKSAQNTGFW